MRNLEVIIMMPLAIFSLLLLMVIDLVRVAKGKQTLLIASFGARQLKTWLTSHAKARRSELKDAFKRVIMKINKGKRYTLPKLLLSNSIY